MNICLILGLLCLVYGLIVAIAGSGGTKFFIVWIGIAVILFVLAGLLHMGMWDRIPQIVRWIFGILCGVFFLSFLVIEGMVIHQMHAQGEDNLDYVIVLGARVRGAKISNSLKQRLDRAIEYSEEYPNTVLVLSGGKGPGEEISEAACMYDYLTAHGVEPGRLILEDQASNTAENFAFSWELLTEAGVDPAEGRVAVVTNDFHIARAELIAAREGYGDVAGIPAPLPWVHLEINYTLREAFAMVKTFLFD